MESSTGIASCIFKTAEGHVCGDTKVYGTGKDALRFCWSHYIVRCADCNVKQATFECAAVDASGSFCRLPMCSQRCYESHIAKSHPHVQETPKRVPIQVVFADGSVHDHTVPETALTEEIVFEHPTTREHARCLKKPQGNTRGPVVYAERPRVQQPYPAPVEIPRAAATAAPAPRRESPLPQAPQNAAVAFALHVSWLLALIETRDERVLRALPAETARRLEVVLAETTVALLEVNPHG
jgi:hypothetical protein